MHLAPSPARGLGRRLLARPAAPGPPGVAPGGARHLPVPKPKDSERRKPANFQMSQTGSGRGPSAAGRVCAPPNPNERGTPPRPPALQRPRGVWGPPHPGGAAALYVRPRCPPGSQGRQRYGPRKRPLPSRLGPSLHFLTLARPRSWPGPQKCGHPREPEPAGTRKGFPSPAPAGPAVEFAAPPSPGPPDSEPGPGPPAGQTARESGGRRECLAAEKEEKARLLAGRLT